MGLPAQGGLHVPCQTLAPSVPVPLQGVWALPLGHCPFQPVVWGGEPLPPSTPFPRALRELDPARRPELEPKHEKSPCCLVIGVIVDFSALLSQCVQQAYMQPLENDGHKAGCWRLEGLGWHRRAEAIAQLFQGRGHRDTMFCLSSRFALGF